jgi:hypothetical protein
MCCFDLITDALLFLHLRQYWVFSKEQKTP